MNLVNECPSISDNWRGGIIQTAAILGLDPGTVRKYAKIGRRYGGIDWKPKPGGKRGMVFFGREIKRFWREYA